MSKIENSKEIPSDVYKCTRCGYEGHHVMKCTASIDIHGNMIYGCYICKPKGVFNIKSICYCNKKISN